MVKRKGSSEGREAEPQKAGCFCPPAIPLTRAQPCQAPLPVLSADLCFPALSPFPQSPPLPWKPSATNQVILRAGGL